MATLSEHHGSDDGSALPPRDGRRHRGRTRTLRILIAALVLRCTTPSASPRTSRARPRQRGPDRPRPRRRLPAGGAGDVRPRVDDASRCSRRGSPSSGRHGRARSSSTARPSCPGHAPRPARPEGPGLIMGGATPAAARRAGAARRRSSCPSTRRCGRPTRTRAARWVAAAGPPAPRRRAQVHPRRRRPRRGPEEIAPHALHETNSYGAWLAGADALGPLRDQRRRRTLRPGATTWCSPPTSAWRGCAPAVRCCCTR